MADDAIELDVSWHPSNSYTLRHRDPGQTYSVDVQEPKGLFCNKNPATFYRAVAAYMASLSAEGRRFTFDDTATAPRMTPGHYEEHRL